jgi:uncharacterized protein (TIGR03437 family)
MRRDRKSFWAKSAVILGAIPVVIWAYEYGPNPGYSGVPGENGGATCTASQCHVGTTNNPANKGSVTVNFPNGHTYTPGVKQHLTVTISDPAPTQIAWGFQLTARPAATPSSMAGSFASDDGNTLLMCSQPNLFIFQQVNYNPSGSQTCPAGSTLQYIEHSLQGYSTTKGPGSGTYQFDWLPPSTDVGNIVIYVAGNAANGDLTVNGDHIYATTYTLTPVASCPSGGPAPSITPGGVVNGASFQPGIVPGSWFTITGANLAASTGTWANSIVNGNLPTSLDCVSVSVGGKPGYVYYVSSTQLNVLAPDAGAGPVPVTVTTPGGTSSAETATSQQYSPAFFLWGGKYAVASRNADGTYIGPTTLFPGSTTPAKPGDVVLLWGTGFGPTDPAAPTGVQTPSDTIYATASPVTVAVGGINATVYSTALSPGFAGLYQVAIQVPASAPDGDLSVAATISGASSPGNVFLTVHH